MSKKNTRTVTKSLVNYDSSHISSGDQYEVREHLVCFGEDRNRTHVLKPGLRIWVTNKDDDYVYFKEKDKDYRYKSTLFGMHVNNKTVEKIDANNRDKS